MCNLHGIKARSSESHISVIQNYFCTTACEVTCETTPWSRDVRNRCVSQYERGSPIANDPREILQYKVEAHFSNIQVQCNERLYKYTCTRTKWLVHNLKYVFHRDAQLYIIWSGLVVICVRSRFVTIRYLQCYWICNGVVPLLYRGDSVWRIRMYVPILEVCRY